MDLDSVDYNSVDSNWEQIKSILDLLLELENLRLWVEADKEPNQNLLSKLEGSERIAENLRDRLISIQIDLLSQL